MNEEAKKHTTGETTTREWKRGVEHKQVKSWLKTVSAFANGIGGSMLFGVGDNGKVVGVDNPKGDIEFISDKIKTLLDPVPDFTLQTERREGKDIIELQVAQGTMTPYYYVNGGSRLAFVRMGDESVAADAHQLGRLVLKGRNMTYDSLPTEYARRDMTFNTLAAAYRNATGHPFEEKLLSSFSLVTTDGHLTNAGVLFADQCPYRHSSLYCTRWDGSDKDNARDAREYQGNLLLLLKAGEQFVDLHNMKGWVKLADKRLNTPDYAPRAVFEAIVNALIHRDYTELGSETHIDIFDECLIVYSPGGMMDGTFIQDQYPDNVASKRRNPVLADVFAQLSLMEKRGSGLRKIRTETAKLPNYRSSLEPVFVSHATEFFTKFYNGNVENPYMVSEPVKYYINDPVQDIERKDDPVNDPVKGIVGQNDPVKGIVGYNDPVNDPVKGTVRQNDPVNDPVKGIVRHNDPANDPVKGTVGQNDPAKLNKLQRDIIEMMRHNSTITRPELCSILGVSMPTVRRAIAKLKAAGAIVRVGADKNGKWTVII